MKIFKYIYIDIHNFDLFVVDLIKCGSIDSNVTKEQTNETMRHQLFLPLICTVFM